MTPLALALLLAAQPPGAAASLAATTPHRVLISIEHPSWQILAIAWTAERDQCRSVHNLAEVYLLISPEPPQSPRSPDILVVGARKIVCPQPLLAR